MAAATSGDTDGVQVRPAAAISSPSRPTMRSIAIGVQVTPLLAMPAKATAMLSGATSLVPITDEGPCTSGSPSARCTPNASAVCRMPQRSSCFAMPMKPVLIDPIVDSSAL